jgi:protein TonB
MPATAATFYEQLTLGRYGAMELKRIVGPNLLRGLAISFAVHALIISSPYIVKLFKGEEVIPPPPIRIVDISQLTKLKSMQETPEQVRLTLPKLAAPTAAIPIAVPEDEVEAQPLIMSQKDLTTVLALTGAEDASLDFKPGEKFEIREEAQESDEIPDAGKFIPFEVPPQPLADFSPKPEYPDVAMATGVKGKVVVQCYVDKTGLVKKFQIISAKPPNLGFEEAVSKVIVKWKFTPAIQNGKPIGVWVEFPFNFELEH